MASRRNNYNNQNNLNDWKPKTELGSKVKKGDIVSIDSVFENGYNILEPEVVEKLIPGIKSEVLLIGQAKGKYGGGQRRAFKQTRKKTKEGEKVGFSAMVAVGDYSGHVGIGLGRGSETFPTREKAKIKAKLNLISLRRGCGSWECGCQGNHSIPYAVEGKCGSLTIRLMSAPKGTGLKVETEVAKVLKLAGISDVWSEVKGKSRSKVNLIKASFNALKKLQEFRLRVEDVEKLGINQGSQKLKLN